MKAVILKHREWDHIFAQIKRDYANTPATYLIRSRMKTDLGFTWREHAVWRDEDAYLSMVDHTDWRDVRSEIHIDFYSEESRTFFLLKYMNYDKN